MDKLPFIRFYPADWLSDEKLRVCSRAARGTWMDLLCLMWKSARRGYLEDAQGRPLTSPQLARVIGCNVQQIKKDIAELEAAGVFSREHHTGVIYSRRLLREIEHVETSGRGGAATSELKATAARANGAKGGRPTKPNENPSKNPREPNPQKDEISDVQKIRSDTIPPSGPVAGPEQEGVIELISTPEAAANPTFTRERNPDLDALATLDGSALDQVTKSAWGAITRAAADIKAVTADLTPEARAEEIRRRAANYRRHFPNASLTATALAKWWAKCATNPAGKAGTKPDALTTHPNDPAAATAFQQRMKAF